MLNSNPSRSGGFTKGSRPFITPRSSKIAPIYLLHILPILASQKLNYKYIRVCGIQIIHISGFFIRITHFFTPRGFRKSPRRFFLAIFRKFWLKIWLQVHYDMPNWNLTRFQGFSGGVPLFSPPGVSQNHPEAFFYLFSVGFSWKFGYKLQENLVTSRLKHAELKSVEIRGFHERIPTFYYP